MTGVVVWMTGLPASGKSTLAGRVQERIPGAVVLDADRVRTVIGVEDHSSAGRNRFYEVLARLSALIAAQGVVVVVPATAHERRFRARARHLTPRFIEVFVRAPREECERRDPKGLYARARAGEIRELPGVDVSYEEPAHPEVIASGGHDEAALDRVVALVGGMRTGAADPPR